MNRAPTHQTVFTSSFNMKLPSNPVTRKFTAKHTTVTGRDPLISRDFKKFVSIKALQYKVNANETARNIQDMNC